MNSLAPLTHLLVLVLLVGFVPATRPAEVVIPDPGLDAAVRETLQKPAGPLSDTDLLSLTNLAACCRNITNLFGLGAARNLEALDMQSNRLSHVALPPGLARLTTLQLGHNLLTNLTLPPDVVSLTDLTLEENPLRTLVLSEFLAATNLADVVAALTNEGVSVFTYPLHTQLATPRKLPGAFQFGLAGPPGIYAVLVSTNFTTWSELGWVSNTLGSISFHDVADNQDVQRFYRARPQPTPTNMVFIPPNTFTMGSPSNDFGRSNNEGPLTTVTLTRGFWIGKYEVTQGEYLSLMATNPSEFPGDLSRPVSSVTWLDATNYCAKLTERELAAGRIGPGSRYRLPTEAEWECATRAGTSTQFSYGDDPNYTNTANYAWFFHGELTVYPVGRKLPNPWGLHDVHGNVWEWCQDWYGLLPGGAVTDPVGPAANASGWKVMRGGAFDYPESSCRSASRLFFPATPFNTDWNLGFRVVLVNGS